MSMLERTEAPTRAAVVDLFKSEREWRVFFRKCCETGALRLRSQAPQVRDELAERGKRFKREEVEDVLLALAREKLPESPAAHWDAEHASELCRNALARLAEHYAGLSEAERDRLDLSAQSPHEEAMVAAGHANDPAAFRAALKAWERVTLEAFENARTGKGAA